MKKIVFTSGLPRSGSTLLSAILNQNPRFRADITSPVRHIFDNIIESINGPGNYKSCFFGDKMDEILRSFLETLYDGNENVYFDHNRTWTARKELLNRLYPDHKMIITVRDICWILDSLENLSRKNLYSKPNYSSSQSSSSIYNRCEQYMENLIKNPYNGLKELIYSNPNFKNCLIIEYDILVLHPEPVMRMIYEHIEEPYFEHNFNDIKNIIGSEIFDKSVNTPGLHDVKKIITPPNRKTILPPDIWEKYSGLEIWKNLKS